MSKMLYFSFFGGVEAPEDSEIERLSYDCREWRQIERRLRNRRPIWSQEGNGLYARAYRCRARGMALLVIECQLGGWVEVGRIRWPLRFMEPAMVAGVCCSPRYGLLYGEEAEEQ